METGSRSRIAATLNNIGLMLHEVGSNSEAETFYLRALFVEPKYAIALNNLGVVRAALGRHDAAIECYRQALAIDGRYAEASNNLGCAFHALNKPDEALAAFRSAAQADVQHESAAVNVVRTLLLLNRENAAVAECRAIMARETLSPETCMFLGQTFRDGQLLEDATAAYVRVTKDNPDYADAYAALAATRQELGDVASARSLLRHAISLSPDTPGYYRGLALNMRFTADDPCFVQLERMVDQLPDMDVPQKVQLHFALGRALADVGRKTEGFAHLLAGNELKRQGIGYDEAAELSRFKDIEAVFSEAFVSVPPPFQSGSELPVFIVGMPRSGSTLIEQILTSHPDVFAGGEMREFEAAVDRAAKKVGATSLAGLAQRWGKDDLCEIAAQYLGHIIGCSRQAAAKKAVLRITDKRLDNIFHVGLIRLLFPRAKIIHARRDPVDTCLSCFSLLFKDAEFTYDLGELGRRFRAYQSLMAHWHRVLPKGSILDVQYEDVVADMETQARRITAHCGLEWDPACLRFHENKRPVRTASVVQVRRPIYATSVGRWRPDKAVLRPLLDALNPPCVGSP